MQTSSLLTSLIKDKFQNESAKEELHNIGKDQNRSFNSNRNQEFQQNNYSIQNGQFNNQECSKDFIGKAQRVTNDTLKQYVQRKIRQELSFILNQPPQTTFNNINHYKQKRENQIETDDKIPLNAKEFKKQSEQIRGKSKSDFTAQIMNLENSLQNSKICLTEINVSSQAYSKYQKKKQKYFQLHKSYQSPLLISSLAQQNEDRLSSLKTQLKLHNNRYEENTRQQLHTSQQVHRNRSSSQSEQNKMIQGLQSSYIKDKAIKLENNQQRQINSDNYQQQNFNQQEASNMHDRNFELDRLNMQSRMSPIKKIKQVKKQNSFSINDCGFYQQFNDNVQIESNQTPINKLRGLSVDQSINKSTDKVSYSHLFSCKSNLISYSTELPSDSFDNNNLYFEHLNNSNEQKENQITQSITTQQYQNFDFPLINQINHKKLSKNQNAQKLPRSPKIIKQNSQLSSHQINSENSFILDKQSSENNSKINKQQSQVIEDHPSLPQLENRQIIPISKYEILSNFKKEYKNNSNNMLDKQERDNQYLQQQSKRIRSYSLIDFDQNQDDVQQKGKIRPKKLGSYDNVGQCNDKEFKIISKKDQFYNGNKYNKEINNFYSNYGDIIIENKYMPKNQHNIQQYNNIKTIDEEETLLNSLDKSGSQFYQLKKYYYKKYANNY